MKTYYIHDGHDQKGPLTLEELLKSGIMADTPIWHSGLESWTDAKNLEELKILFAEKAPPPFIKPFALVSNPVGIPDSTNNPPAPRSKAQNSILKKVFLTMLVIGIAFVAFVVYMNNRPGSYSGQRSYYNSRLSVVEYERLHPAEFLEAAGTYRETFLGNKLKVQGVVTNKATVANFKDIIIEVSYYASTKTLINTERFVLYDYVQAHSKKTFEWKIKPPTGTETIGWEAVGATPYY
jgi:GYF domain 2